MPPRGTRPTSDRVREAVFSALAARVDFAGVDVLDLYSGSGALGLEALSRGASGALFVEADARAARTIEANAVNAGLRGARVRKGTVAAALAAGGDREYGLIFCDPPYDLPDEALAAALAALAGGGWAADGALVVVERSARGAPPRWPDGFAPVVAKRYGETRVDIAACYRHDP